MKKKIFKRIMFVLITLIIMPFAYAVFQECNKVSFCSGSYNLTCSFTSDNYCPEDYGNWGPPGNNPPCKVNPYGTKCFPCDPDCATAQKPCGDIMISMPSNAYPSELIYANISIHTEETDFIVVLYQEDLSPVPGGVTSCPDINNNCICNNGVCEAKLPTAQGTQVPTIGGTLYMRGASAPLIIPDDIIWGFGVTKPNVNIEQPPQQSTQSGTFTIKTKAFSAFTPDIFTGYSGITSSGRVIYDITGAAGEGGGEGTPSNNKLTKLELYLYKETYPGNYEEANPDNNCATCSSDDCNLIGEWDKINSGGFTQSGSNGEYFDYSWDSSDCGGDITSFKITAVAYDGYTTDGSAINDVYFTLENENAPCIENCPKVSTNLLNLIISKIKVWL